MCESSQSYQDTSDVMLLVWPHIIPDYTWYRLMISFQGISVILDASIFTYFFAFIRL